MDEINTLLFNAAMVHGLCDNGQKMWDRSFTKDELCKLYLRNMDFIIENNYPSIQFMKAHFDGVCQQYGIYVNDKICDKDNNNAVNIRHLVANGNSSGTIIYDKYSVGIIYARHESNLTIIVKDNALVSIELYDDATLNITVEGGKAVVHQHGGYIIAEGNVSIHDAR